MLCSVAARFAYPLAARCPPPHLARLRPRQLDPARRTSQCRRRVVLRRRRLLRCSLAERGHHRAGLQPVRHGNGAVQRGAAESRRRLLALQAARRLAPLLLRTAAQLLIPAATIPTTSRYSPDIP